MVKWRKTEGRFFVESRGMGDGFKYLPACKVQFIHNNEIDMDFGDELPAELNKVLPQVVYIVYQKTNSPQEMFDDTKPGKMLVISGFTTNFKAAPPMFIRHEDGHVERPKPDINFSCWDIAVVRGEDVELQA